METGTTQNRKESVGSPCSNGPVPSCETIIIPISSLRNTIPLDNKKPKSILSPPRSPSDGQKMFNMTQPGLSSRQLLSELKAGITLRPTHQSTGLTTVFSGSGKNIRKLSVDRKSEDGSHGSAPSSPSDELPVVNGQITELESSASEAEGR